MFNLLSVLVMACRQTFRCAVLGKSLRFKTSLTASLSGMQQSLYRVSALSRSPMLSAKHTAVMSAPFHTSPMKMNEFVLNIQDEEDFKARVLNNSKPVIVDFFATWVLLSLLLRYYTCTFVSTFE